MSVNQVILDKLYEPDQELNPSFTETRKFQIASEDMAKAVQFTIKKAKLISREIINHSDITFDVLDLQLGGGEHYMLTQVIVKQTSDGSEVIIKQKPKPYMGGTIGNSLNVRRFFGKIESAWEMVKNQSYDNPPEQKPPKKQ